ncbi:MAG: phage Gp37/Gp68 family protein [Spirochaetaceae bacterium]|nr:phage Gp37/Gp68 family protein [Spirochaetaceae bacterium]
MRNSAKNALKLFEKFLCAGLPFLHLFLHNIRMPDARLENEGGFLFDDLPPPKTAAPKSVMWNLWHGCLKYSEGCQNCYVYRGDKKWGRDSRDVRKTVLFDMPLERYANGDYKYPSGSQFWTCFSSDFFLEDAGADMWRREAWRMMRERGDCAFFFITKRILRFRECIPADWGAGYENVTIGVTCENQRRAGERLPFFRDIPAARKVFIHEPLLSPLDISAHLFRGVERVVAGGESGENARPCRYEWFLSLRDQCAAARVPFVFKQTGARFIKDGKLYVIPRRLQHIQAAKANINYTP